jgi:hypothetical protein
MKAHTLAKKLLAMPADTEMFVVLPSGKAVPIRKDHVVAIKAAPQPHDEGGVKLVRSKRASKRGIIALGVVGTAGEDDTVIVPVARPGIDI